MSAPLSGITVLDLSSVISGPYASSFLAESGADVIKIEAPGGDLMRWIGGHTPVPGMSPKFLQINRNKRSVALDLKHPRAKEVMARLISRADVLLHNMRLEALARLELDYASLAEAHPRLIHCGIVGFKPNGPYSHKPAYDSIIQGSTGLAAAIALQTGQPRYVPMVIADRTIGLLTAYHIAVALAQRHVTGRGGRIEVPMFESMARFVLNEHMGGLVFDPPHGAPADTRLSDPRAAPIATSDGFVCVTANTDKQVFALLDLIGRPELKSDPRYATPASRYKNIKEFYRLRAEAFLARTTAEWLELLDRADIPALPYNTLESLVEDEHLQAVGFFESMEQPGVGPIRIMRDPSTYPGSDARVDRPAPRFGEHTLSVLLEMGFSREDAEAFVATAAA